MRAGLSSDKRLLLWVSPREWKEIELALEDDPSYVPIVFRPLDEKGYSNAILDYPIGKVVAVLEKNHNEARFTGMEFKPPYNRMCVVSIKNHRNEFAIFRPPIDSGDPIGQWDIYGDGAGLEGDIQGWILLPEEE